MKTNYERPAILFENYDLRETSTGGCGAPGGGGSLGRPSHWNRETCGWDMGGLIIWAIDPVCNEIRGENDTVYGICYNNPEGGYNIFNS